MEVPWLLVVHGSVTALVVVSFLCGQWPIFEGTFIQSVNHFLTFGAYHYLLYVLAPPFPMPLPSRLLLLLLSECGNCSRRRFVQSVCGTGARDLVLGVERYCCDRPNPILQVHATHQYLNS